MVHLSNASRSFYVSKEETFVMKSKTISSVFVLFTIVTGLIAMSPASFADYLHPIHSAYADHHSVTITPVSGSGSGPGCELTNDGCFSPNTVTV